MYLHEIFLQNTGPISECHIKPPFDDNGNPLPIVIVGPNGSGKSIFLSYIVDALAEFAKKAFRDIVPLDSSGSTPYFRVIHPRAIRSGQPFSLSLLRFEANDDNLYYCEKSGILDPAADFPDVKPVFAQVCNWSAEENHKDVSVNKEIVKTEMQNGAHAFFPASRREDPDWLNPKSLNMGMDAFANRRFSHQLDKPLWVGTCAEENISWVLDVFLDSLINMEKRFGVDQVTILEMPEAKRIISERYSEFERAFGYYQVTNHFEVEVEKRFAQGTKPLILTEVPLDSHYIQTALALLGEGELLNVFDIDFVGLENEEGTHYGGDKGLNHFRNLYAANPSLFHRPILLLYDCDTQKPNEQVGKLWVRSIPRNTENTKVKVGIENLFPADLFQDCFYSEVSTKDGVYCHRKFRPLSNIRLCYNDNLFEKELSDGEPNAESSHLSLKQKLCLRSLSGESSQAELCRRHNLSENQVSTWKRQFLENAETFFESPERHADASVERIAQLEQLVGRLTLALEIQKKASTLLD